MNQRRWILAATFAIVGGALLAHAFGLVHLSPLQLGGLLVASTSPVFGSSPMTLHTPGALTAANAALDGTGTTLLLVTAAVGGTFVESVRCVHKGTNVATVARVFLNNGSSAAVAANNILIAEETIAANTLSQVAKSVPVDIVLNRPLKGGGTPERIYTSIGTAVAAGIGFSAQGGDL